jgi:hypothetical protein
MTRTTTNPATARRPARALAAALLLAGAAHATDPLDCAVQAADFLPGPSGDVSANEALGVPLGAGLFEGSFDTTVLGVGGVLTLELGNRCVDGAGTDLLVCENPFLVGGGSTSFVEACFVEVSSDGTHFARFPNRYAGTSGPFLPFTGNPPGWYAGFAGVHPVRANPAAGIDPQDLVIAGGDAFDLADLADHPAVLSGDVDLADIAFVRLVDIDSGADTDDSGTPIWDCGIDSVSSADIDALVAVNSDANVAQGRPLVELSLDAAGFLWLQATDPDGLKDFKNGLSASIDGAEIPFGALLPFLVLVQFDAQGFTFVTGPVPPGVFALELRVGARDQSGRFGGDALAMP